MQNLFSFLTQKNNLFVLSLGYVHTALNKAHLGDEDTVTMEKARANAPK